MIGNIKHIKELKKVMDSLKSNNDDFEFNPTDFISRLGIDIDESHTTKVETIEDLNEDDEINRIAMEERIQLKEMEYVYNDDDEDIPDDALMAS